MGSCDNDFASETVSKILNPKLNIWGWGEWLNQREDSPLLMGLVKVMPDVSTEFSKQKRSAFLATAPVPNRVLDLDLVKHRTVIQLDEQRISDRAFLWVMVLSAEPFVLDTINLGTKCVDARISG